MLRLTVAVALCIPAAALAQENLVANPGFEEGAERWGLINNWYAQNDPKRASPGVIDESAAHSGNASLRIDGQGSRGLAIQSPLKVQAAAKYRVSCWMKGENMGAARAGPLIEFWNADNTHLRGRFWAEDVPQEWTRLSNVIYAPEGTAYAKIMCATTASNDGQVWFDDVEVRLALPPPPVPVQVRGQELAWDDYQAPASVAYYRVYVAQQPFDSVALMQAAAWLPGDARSVEVADLPGATGKTHFAVVAVDEDDLEDPNVTCVEVKVK